MLLQDSPWMSWLVGEVGGPAALLPVQHYIPVRYDLLDLVEKLEWLQEHEEESKQLAESSQRWALRFMSYDWVLLYLDRVVRRYAQHLDASALLDVSA